MRHLGRDRILDLLDDSLDAATERVARGHLATCAGCARVYRSQREVRGVLRSSDAPPPQVDLIAGLMALAALGQPGEHGSEAGGTLVTSSEPGPSAARTSLADVRRPPAASASPFQSGTSPSHAGSGPVASWQAMARPVVPAQAESRPVVAVVLTGGISALALGAALGLAAAPQSPAPSVRAVLSGAPGEGVAAWLGNGSGHRR